MDQSLREITQDQTLDKRMTMNHIEFIDLQVNPEYQMDMDLNNTRQTILGTLIAQFIVISQFAHACIVDAISITHT